MRLVYSRRLNWSTLIKNKVVISNIVNDILLGLDIIYKFEINQNFLGGGVIELGEELFQEKIRRNAANTDRKSIES